MRFFHTLNSGNELVPVTNCILLVICIYWTLIRKKKYKYFLVFLFAIFPLRMLQKILDSSCTDLDIVTIDFEQNYFLQTPDLTIGDVFAQFNKVNQ